MSSTVVPGAYDVALAEIDVSNTELHQVDVARDYLKRLRQEAPVHLCTTGPYAPYWSITKFHDIMSVDSNHKTFTSTKEVVIDDVYFAGGHVAGEVQKTSMIVMDPPDHTQRRNMVSPGLAPGNIAKLEAGIRERTQQLLDSLPVGETFNWVDEVSVELTLRLLATLVDYPFEDRHRLLYWSNVSTGFPGDGVVESWEHRSDVLREIATYFTGEFRKKIEAPPGPDLISMLAKSPLAQQMTPKEFIGTVTLILVGGNDTTRNSMSGSILAMHQFPDEFAKLKRDPSLVPVAVSEILRWQTPVTYMRRTALEDCEIRGRQIRKGDKVVMWYLSGNRDEEIYERPDDFIIGRPNPRQHLTFGFGVHRCLGNRLGEMQLRILWEEILQRFSRIEVVGEPIRINHNMFRGFKDLPVRVYR